MNGRRHGPICSCPFHLAAHALRKFLRRFSWSQNTGMGFCRYTYLLCQWIDEASEWKIKRPPIQLLLN
jgi:hypothetical protein